MHWKNSRRRILCAELVFLSLYLALPSPIQSATPTWTFTGPNGGPGTFATNPMGGSVLYTGGVGGVWKSINNGDTWEFLPNSPGGVVLLAMNPNDASTVYAAHNEAVFKSADAGQTWSKVFDSFSGPGINRTLTGLIVDPNSPNIVYVSFNNTVDPGGGPLYRTDNGGTTWTSITPSILEQGNPMPQVTGINSLSMDHFITRILYFTGTNMPFGNKVYRSEDSGLTCVGRNVSFFGVSNVYAQPDVQFRVYGFGGGGVYQSNDLGNNWFSIDQNVLNAATYILASQHLGWATIAGTHQNGVYRWYSPNGVWTQVNNGLGNRLDGLILRELSLAGSNIFASLDSGVYRTGDVGGSWELKNTGLSNSQVTSLAVANDAKHTIYAGVGDRINLYGGSEQHGGAGVFKSTDGGKTWKSISQGLVARPRTSDTLYPLSVYGLAVEQQNPLKVYAATSQGFFRSINGGANWLSSPFAEADSVLVDPVIPGTVITHGTFCTSDSNCNLGFWRSGDSGQTWAHLGQQDGFTINDYTHAIAIGPASFPVYALAQGGVARLTHPEGVWEKAGDMNEYSFCAAVDRRFPNTVYAGTTGGLFKSTDYGDTWTKLPTSFSSNQYFESVTVDPLTSDVFVGISNDPTSWTSDDGGQTWHHPSGGVWRSGDGGDTWVDMGLPKGRSVNTVALSPALSSIFAGIEGLGVGVSSNLTRPTRPLQLAVKALSATKAVLSWLDTSDTEDGFKMERKDGACASSGTWTQIGKTQENVAYYTNAGLKPGATYSYQVRAYNTLGDSLYSNCATVVMPNAGAPPTPTALTATSISGLQVNLRWTDTSGGAAKIRVYRKKGALARALLTTVPAGSTGYSDMTALGNNATASYTYDVQACSVNDSTCSTTTLTAIVPFRPTELSASPANVGVYLTWVDESINESGFEIHRKEGGCPSAGAWKPLADMAPNLQAYTDTLAFSGKTYAYRIRSYHKSAVPTATGYSRWSTCAEAIMP
jgi:photosystem II stability/assembly factor-like uncharacterized protein